MKIKIATLGEQLTAITLSSVSILGKEARYEAK